MPTAQHLEADTDRVMNPWLDSLQRPHEAQLATLRRLVSGYARTTDGRNHRAPDVDSVSDFRTAYPVRTFADFKPVLDAVIAGDVGALLPDEPLALTFTKGTSGEPKTIPFTVGHAELLRVWYARAIAAHCQTTGRTRWTAGYRLNLTSSSRLKSVQVGARVLDHGYSIAVHLNHMHTRPSDPDRIAPSRAAMEELPKEPSKENWEKRYEVAFQASRDLDVTHLAAPPNVALGFGEYLRTRHGARPRDVWPSFELILTGGVPGTHTVYARALRQLYGTRVSIREIYVSTEGAYGAQVDGKPAWSPMYDQLFFEVQTTSTIKLLHEMTPGEIGTLIVSTPVLPRYRTGDLILAFDPPYFRCIGREGAKLAPFAFGSLAGKSRLKLASAALPTFR